MSVLAETEPQFIDAAQKVYRWIKRVSEEEYRTFGDEPTTYSDAAKAVLIALEEGDIFFRVRPPIPGKPMETVTQSIRMATGSLEMQTSVGNLAEIISLEVNADITPRALIENGLYVLAYLYRKHMATPLIRVEGGKPLINRLTATNKNFTTLQTLTRFPRS